MGSKLSKFFKYNSMMTLCSGQLWSWKKLFRLDCNRPVTVSVDSAPWLSTMDAACCVCVPISFISGNPGQSETSES